MSNVANINQSNSAFLELETRGTMKAVTLVKEGAAGGDGANSLSLRIEATAKTEMIALAMLATTSVRDLKAAFWGPQSRKLQIANVEKIVLDKEVGGAYFSAFDLERVPCVMKKMTCSPMANYDLWWFTFSAYIPNAEMEYVDAARVMLKDQFDFHFEQVRHEYNSPDEDQDDLVDSAGD